MIWLSRMSVSDFRCLGKLDVELPRRGLVIFAGPNGLGKSSVFEAIEWGLTADSARRQAFRPDKRDNRTYFARQRPDGKEVARYSVRLQFEDGEKSLAVSRVGGAVGSSGTGTEELLRTLVRPGWGVESLDRLRTYLHLTHLLSQSRVVQPLFLEEQEQWAQAEGLFRLGTVEAARANLQRILRASSRFSQRVAALQATAEEARQSLRVWTALVEGISTREKELSSGRSHTSEVVAEHLAQVAEALAVQSASWEGRPLGEVVSLLRGAALERRASLLERKSLLAALGRAVGRYVDAEAELDAVRNRGAEVVGLIKSVEENAGKLQEERRLVLDARDAARRRLSDIRERELRLQNALETAADLRTITQAVAELGGTVDLPSRPTMVDLWERTAISGTADKLREARRRMSGLDRQRIEAQRRAFSACELELERVSGELREVEASRDALARRIAERREVAGRLTKLVSEILAEVSEQDCDCPVCGTSFPNDRVEGSFQDVVRGRLQGADELLGLLETQMSEVQHRYAEVSVLHRAATTARDTAKTAWQGIDAILRSTVEVLSEAVRVPPQDEWLSSYLGDDTDLRWTTDRVESERARARAEGSVAEGALSVEERRLADLSQAADDVEAALLKLRSDLAALGARESVLDSAQRSTRLQWEQSGLESVPSPTPLASELAEVEDLLAAVEEGGAIPGKLVLLEQALAHDDSVRSLERDRKLVAEEAARLNCRPEEVLSVHSRFVSEAERRAQASQIVAHQLSDLQPRLDEAVVRYRKEVFEPLAPAMRGWLSTLLADRSWEAVDGASERGGRPGIELMYRLLDVEGRVVKGSARPARQILSEGQLAAVAVARLLTWNSAFAWSRWPAILLDDPVQYSDMIHVAGLADALRGLVEARQVQIMLSTHDLDVAQYFRRKFEVRGIPVTLVRFDAPTADGVSWSIA